METFKKWNQKRDKEKAENKAFKDELDKKLRATRRKAYEEEALKIAEKRGRDIAHRPTFFSRLASEIARAKSR